MISSEARAFLAKYIDSAELLDILMLLYREPEGIWTAEVVSNRVFTVPQAAEKRLEELQARGLAKTNPDHPGAFRLAVDDPKVAKGMTELRQAYETSRADVIGLVFSIKADPLQSFSNAFKLRGDS
jgi:hypothetical protein